MPCNYSKLKGKIKEYYGTQNAFAIQLKIGRVALSSKLTGKTDFTQSEIFKAARLLGISQKDIPLYFFELEV